MKFWVLLFKSVHELRIIKISFNTLVKKLRNIESNSLEHFSAIIEDCDALFLKQVRSRFMRIGSATYEMSRETHFHRRIVTDST